MTVLSAYLSLSHHYLSLPYSSHAWD